MGKAARIKRERNEQPEPRPDAHDRPITPEGADLMARRYGYRLASLGSGEPGFEDRFLAVFMPEPDGGGEAFIADGRTQVRALRRGLDVVRLKARHPAALAAMSKPWEPGKGG